MRQAYIFYKDLLAGILTENDAGYEFHYLPEYLSVKTQRHENTASYFPNKISTVLSCLSKGEK